VAGRRAQQKIATRALAGLACALVATTAIACGGGGDPVPTPTPPTGGTEVVITITSSGASPRSISVSAGTQVTFVNNDTRVHQMSSDPHPDHTNCPEINFQGQLAPGQRRQTGNLNAPGSCGFHDHLQNTNTSLQGTITVR
jgi:plastocyanin